MLPSTETFGIPELLGMILENAEPRDLLLWQRVNKTWQAAIQRSPRIQEKLYFKVESCKDEDDEQRAVLNPFMDVFLHQECSNIWHWIAKDAFDGKASYPTASWQYMLITNPAKTELEFFRRGGHEGGLATTFSWKIACESGITIGQLADNHRRGNTALLEVSHDHDDGDEAIWTSGLGTCSFTGSYRR